MNLALATSRKRVIDGETCCPSSSYSKRVLHPHYMKKISIVPSRFYFHHSIIALAAGLLLAKAEDKPEPTLPTDAEQTKAPSEPQIEKIDATHYRVGKIHFDQKTREIRLPAKVNMSGGLLEFLLVQPHGKVHESLLVTDASAMHLNLAFTLLRYLASKELFSLIDETGHPTGEYPVVAADVKAQARIMMHVQWTDKGVTHRVAINDWIQHSEKFTTMPKGPWIYSGSRMYQGKYVPDLTGDIAAIFTSQEAMINYPGSGSDSDLVWFAFEKNIPAKGTDVTLIITPFTKFPEPSSPPYAK